VVGGKLADKPDYEFMAQEFIIHSAIHDMVKKSGGLPGTIWILTLFQQY
jgi:hypothetical protein